jgi:hypothetical protein
MQLKNVVIKENSNVVWSNGQFLGNDSGIYKGYEDGDYVSFEVGPGIYSFELTGSPMDVLKFLSFRVSKNAVEQNEPVFIYANVKNLLAQRNVVEVKVYINNIEKASKYVVLGANEAREISFLVRFNVTGSYEIRIDELSPVIVTVNPSLSTTVWVILIGLTIAIVIALYFQQKKTLERKIINAHHLFL